MRGHIECYAYSLAHIVAPLGVVLLIHFLVGTGLGEPFMISVGSIPTSHLKQPGLPTISSVSTWAFQEPCTSREHMAFPSDGRYLYTYHPHSGNVVILIFLSIIICLQEKDVQLLHPVL